MIKLFLAFLCSFLLSLILMPIIIKIFSRNKATQTILGYVEEHKTKNGTLTMGGVVFIISTLLLGFVFLKYSTPWFMCMLVSAFFGVLGFMDDFIKIKFKQNLGLRAYQKIIGQFGIAVIFAVYVFLSSQGGQVYIPFINKTIDLGFWIIPIIIFILLATTNSVNLTDGLDGLAGKVSQIYLFFFVVIIGILSKKLFNAGETGEILTNIKSIQILSTIFIGSITAFLLFNTNKAKIFMGDVGSLCLGGFIGSSACLLGVEFIIPILGFCFVFSAISVILQVLYFKKTKKRIFKMAPFHHHLQMSGMSEPKVVELYATITTILGVVILLFYFI